MVNNGNVKGCRNGSSVLRSLISYVPYRILKLMLLVHIPFPDGL